MRRQLAVVLVPLAIAAAAPPAVASGQDAHSAATTRVRVGDLFFKKSSITIQSGDTVRWRWVGVAPHNVTVKRGPRKFHSRTKTSGSYQRTLRRRGTYRYVCTVHPDAMRGKIVVE